MILAFIAMPGEEGTQKEIFARIQKA